MHFFDFFDLIGNIDLSTLSKSKASLLAFVSWFLIPVAAPLLVIEFTRLSERGYPGKVLGLIIFISLISAIGIALLLFIFRFVHAYKPTEFLVFVLSLTLMLSASTFYIIRKHQLDKIKLSTSLQHATLSVRLTRIPIL
ncbi:hypothetical protein J0X19_19585 [Hymenobacter sp. BT186]|uniref:Uncharacterized protein n=1 Tax=Hymenobacter telluris TaxID=2816474 RepID=A0A939F2G6_9BACT|nr:hypothetical protein [Hymenobacter telluris]MBO0360173.1 hypothetical protein [Hymenobacter telluris]MBW3376200.1 hypothetical protein [Hymenobacter norwichensis]